MSKTQTYSMEKILAAREILRNLPAKEKEKSRAEVVSFLKGDLRTAMKQGHSLKDIQAILAEQGITVSLSGIEAVLGRPGKISARKNRGIAQSSPKTETATPPKEVTKEEVVTPDAQTPPPAQKDKIKLPSYFTPDLPDDQL